MDNWDKNMQWKALEYTEEGLLAAERIFAAGYDRADRTFKMPNDYAALSNKR